MVQNSPPKPIKSSDHLLEDYQSLNSGKSSLERLIAESQNVHCLVVSNTNMRMRIKRRVSH